MEYIETGANFTAEEKGFGKGKINFTLERGDGQRKRDLLSFSEEIPLDYANVAKDPVGC